MKKLKIGLVGAGRVTIHHIELLKKLSNYIKIEAVCDLVTSKSKNILIVSSSQSAISD